MFFPQMKALNGKKNLLAAVWTKRGWDDKGVEEILGDISERGMVNGGGANNRKAYRV